MRRKGSGVPVQFPREGVTKMIAVSGIPDATGIKVMFPLPFVGSPMLGLLLVYWRAVLPALKLMVAGRPAQNFWTPGLLNVGVVTMLMVS